MAGSKGLATAALALGAFLVAGCTFETAPSAPRHLVLVSIDTLRAETLGCYGHPYVESPNLDQLAASGVRFDRFFTAASTTLSSHTTLFTGTYPHTHGVVSNGHAVAPSNRMLPEILTDEGFACAGFVGAVPLESEVGFDQGFGHFDAEMGTGSRIARHQRPANEVTDAALSWLDQRSGVGRSERLFLFVHYYDVHWPYAPPAPYLDMYRTERSGLEGEERDLRAARRLLEEAASQGPGKQEPGFAERVLADEAIGRPLARALEADYAAGVTWTDSEVGRLLGGLALRGIESEALVVVTSDHGETLAEHANVINHGATVYDTEMRVPLIVRFPGEHHAGRVIDRMTSGVDLLPTLLAWMDLSDAQASKVIEGEDVSGILEGELPPRLPVFAEATKPTGDIFNADEDWPNRDKFQCIRTRRHKYMFRLPDEHFRLYDVEVDPAEAQDLLLEPDDATRALANELDAKLRTWRDDVRTGRASVPVDSERQREGLEALGYAGDDEGD